LKPFLVFLFLYAVFGLSYAQTDPRLDQYAMDRHHSSDTIFFDWVEDGVGGKQFVTLKFTADESHNGLKSAECIYTVIYVNKDKKRSELNMFHFSTNENSMENLSISPKSVTFDIDVGWFEQGGNKRQLKFIATREGSSSTHYQARAIGLWKSMFDETKMINVEWKQVHSVALPYPMSEW